MPEMHPLCVRNAHHRSGVQTHANREALRQMLIAAGPHDLGGPVTSGHSGRESTLALEEGLEVGRVYGLAIRGARFCWVSGKHLSELFIKVDQFPGHRVAFVGISAQ